MPACACQCRVTESGLGGGPALGAAATVVLLVIGGLSYCWGHPHGRRPERKADGDASSDEDSAAQGREAVTVRDVGCQGPVHYSMTATGPIPWFSTGSRYWHQTQGFIQGGSVDIGAVYEIER